MSLRARSDGKEVILVVGATGDTGIRVVRRLLSRGFRVRALVRDLQKAAKLLPSSAELVQGDTTILSTLEPAFEGVERVICTTGPRYRTNLRYILISNKDLKSAYGTDFIGIRNLVAVAKTRQVKHFVLISTICVTRPLHYMSFLLNSLFCMVMKWKLEGERCLVQSGIPYTIIRPGRLVSLSPAFRRIAVSQGDTARGIISRAHVAELVVQSLFSSRVLNTTFECVWQEQPSSAAHEGGNGPRHLTPQEEEVIADENNYAQLLSSLKPDSARPPLPSNWHSSTAFMGWALIFTGVTLAVHGVLRRLFL